VRPRRERPRIGRARIAPRVGRRNLGKPCSRSSGRAPSSTRGKNGPNRVLREPSQRRVRRSASRTLSLAIRRLHVIVSARSDPLGSELPRTPFRLVGAFQDQGERCQVSRGAAPPTDQRPRLSLSAPSSSTRMTCGSCFASALSACHSGQTRPPEPVQRVSSARLPVVRARCPSRSLGQPRIQTSQCAEPYRPDEACAREPRLRRVQACRHDRPATLAPLKRRLRASPLGEPDAVLCPEGLQGASTPRASSLVERGVDMAVVPAEQAARERLRLLRAATHVASDHGDPRPPGSSVRTPYGIRVAGQDRWPVLPRP